MIEESSKTLKVLLGILLIILIATVAFVFLSQRGTKERVTTVPVSVPVKTDSSTAKTITETPVFKPIPASEFLSAEEIQKQLKAIQDKVNAGTLSAEEAKKQRDSIIVRMEPPVLKK